MTEITHENAWLNRCYNAMGRNFMTPSVLQKRFLVDKKTVVELARGTGMKNQPIFGVTVLVFGDDGERTFPKPDLSQLFQSLDEAESYYNDCV